ncbi:MAG: hypothetical protein O9267_10680 [Flavobacterium sp.]|uniref:hypothetical protein n=1 Tax=Flavobacterium sp. TaxID=239 RepID=UPI0022BBD05D|nr:hypothetical protein [Flavobacterium sp.]MCZ8198062.1 hypothetical protein [Flavobacterium sp.]
MLNRYKILFSVVVAFVAMSFSFETKPQMKNENNTFLQDTLTWKQLSVIRFVSKKHPTYGEISFPVVNDNLKKLANKKVVIKGFIVPIDSKNYAISKNVFASCFFCGKAGPETIAGLKFKGNLPKLKTDQYVTVQGVFRYNEDNADDWIYNIDDVVIVKGN